jgi:hypothetical protein
MPSKIAKRTAKNPAPAQQQTAQIRLDAKADTPSYYVNYAAVSHTPYDFTLSLVRVPAPLTEEHLEFVKSGKPIPMEPLLQVILPPLLVDGLIKALVDQKEKHAKTLLQQVKNNEQQHQHIKSSGTVH